VEFYIKKGSTLPVISYEVTEDGINNLDSLLGSQNYVCTFSLLRKDGSFVIFKKPAQVEVRNEGEKFGLFLTYQFSKKETSTSGDYYGQFHLNSVDGERFFKRDGKIPIFILDAISDNELCCKSSNLKDDEQVITGTPERTPTNTPTFTFTPTISNTVTLTPTVSNTVTLTPTNTTTTTLTPTNTLTPSPTIISVTAGPTFDLSSQETNPRDLTFNNDGTKMFIAGVTGDDILEYTLSVGYDLSSTVTYVQSVSVPSNPSAVRFNDDGTKMFVNGYDQNRISYYNLTTAFDVSTAVYQGASPSTIGRDNDTFGMDFSDDGTKVYITGNQNDKIYEYDLPSAYDVTSLTFVQDFYVGNLDIEPFGIEFCNGGTRLLIVGTRGNGVLEFELSSAFDISTASYVGFYFIGGNPSGIHIDPDGTKMFIVGTASDQVKSYTLSQPCRLVVQVTPTPTNSVTPTNTLTPTITSSVTPSVTLTNTQTNTPSTSVTPSVTPSVTLTNTPTMTMTTSPTLWQPTNISLAFWVDASDTSSYTTSGSNIATVTDKAGNFTLGVTGSPNINNSLDGKNVFTFGSGESMESSNEAAQCDASGNHWAIGVMQWNVLNNSQDSLWSVENNTVANTSKRDYAVSAANSSAFNGELDLDALSSNRISSTIGNAQAWDSSMPQNTWEIVCLWFNKDGNQIGMRRDGDNAFTPVDDYDNALNTNLDIRLFRNRAAERMRGRLAEFFTVKDVPGTGGTDLTELIKAEGYLAHKWGLTGLLPSDHPYKSSQPTI